jgi:hypothetical protein
MSDAEPPRRGLDPARLLAHALRERCLPQRYDGWEQLLRIGREADLLGTLADRLEARGELYAVPAQPRAHLLAARTQCRAQQGAVRREVSEIMRALKALGIPIILLKGAAYLVADLPPSRGRLFSDIDILVAKDALPEVESALMLAGFATTHLHPHDQRYYRRWMHELPPMQHVKRSTVLDVHHTIVPETARVALDPRALFRAALPLADPAGFSVLAPEDMVLHSATHLFHNEELTHGLRDLIDIDALLGHFGDHAGFWTNLTARAAELDVGRPLYYALRWASRMLETPMPAGALADVARHAPARPVLAIMDALFEAGLQPNAAKPATRRARRLLYLRGHWLKMPVPLLAWHLTFKALRGEEQPA